MYASEEYRNRAEAHPPAPGLRFPHGKALYDEATARIDRIEALWEETDVFL